VGSEFTVENLTLVRSEALANQRKTKATDDSSIQSSESPTFDVFFAQVGDDNRLVDFVVKGLEFLKLKTYIAESTSPSSWFKEHIYGSSTHLKAAIIALSAREIANVKVLHLRSFVSQCVEYKIPVITVVPQSLGEIPGNLDFLKELTWLEFGDRNLSRTAFEKLIKSII
jgi:hypothetical protein